MKKLSLYLQCRRRNRNSGKHWTHWIDAIHAITFNFSKYKIKQKFKYKINFYSRPYFHDSWTAVNRHLYLQHLWQLALPLSSCQQLSDQLCKSCFLETAVFGAGGSSRHSPVLCKLCRWVGFEAQWNLFLQKVVAIFILTSSMSQWSNIKGFYRPLFHIRGFLILCCNVVVIFKMW